MKKLMLGFAFLFNVTFAHSIPPQLLAFMAENPDATTAQLEAFIENSDFAATTELWTGNDNPQSFNLPPILIDFLLNNQDANEPEIMAFIASESSLQGGEWEKAIKTLSGGEGFNDDSPFSLNDLALLSQLGQTFDSVYETKNLNWWQFAKNYINLGIEHILIGLDHILFVMSLVLLLPSIKHIFKMVTTFTVAHSLTLLLGGTNVLNLSAKVVEPIIAASIAYVALTSVFLSKKYPWFAKTHASLAVIFVFGLFHGLGFAGVFAEYSPEPSRLIPSLLFFNVGVEIGQLLILLMFVPFLWALKHFKIENYFIKPFAVLISLLAIWWVVVRVLF